MERVTGVPVTGQLLFSDEVLAGGGIGTLKEVHTHLDLMFTIHFITVKVIIGASLSEPHIDRDNVPRRGECLYLCMWPRVAFVASMFPRTRLFNQ